MERRAKIRHAAREAAGFIRNRRAKSGGGSAQRFPRAPGLVREAPDPKQLWIEHRLEGSLELNQPNSLQIADFDGDGRLDLLVAERAGAGRMIVFQNLGG